MEHAMVMKIHTRAHRTVEHPITVETTHVAQVNPVQVAHRIVGPVRQPIHVQIQMTSFLERHVNMLKWLLFVHALQHLHRHLHKLLVEPPPRHIHLLHQILALEPLPKHIRLVTPILVPQRKHLQGHLHKHLLLRFSIHIL